MIRKMGRMPKGELRHSASDRIRATNPHRSHLHEHLGDDLIPRGEPAHNRARRLQHVGVSGTGQSIARVVGLKNKSAWTAALQK